MKTIIILVAALFTASVAYAQEYVPELEKTRGKRAWEFGLGGSVFQFNRVGTTAFTTTDEGHHVNLQLRHAVFGGNIYVARELTNAFAADFQGTLGYAESEWLAQAGLGLQWRLGHYFDSPDIDPYLRVGGNYLYKGFDVLYGSSLNGMDWNMENNQNKEGADGRRLLTVAAGVGVNMWLNDRFGVGIQGDYLLVPKPDVANSLQGTARLLWRFGGEPRRAAAPPEIRYVDRPVEVERVVERIVEVEKIVEVPDRGTLLTDLSRNIFFDFDRATLTEDSETVLDQIAEIMKGHADGRYLISGFTDTRGSDSYNLDLSERRAMAVVDALVARGVPRSRLQARGAGERIALAEPATSDEIRRGDRKVTIEVVTNDRYWEYLQQKL